MRALWVLVVCVLLANAQELPEPVTPKRARVREEVAQKMATHRVEPVAPSDVRISGSVKLNVVMGGGGPLRAFV